MRYFALLPALLAAADIVSAATGYIHAERSLGRLSKKNMEKERWTSTNPYVTVQGSVCTVKVSKRGVRYDCGSSQADYIHVKASKQRGR